MTTPNPMLAELDEVVRLMEAATPDVWLNDGPHLFIDTRVQVCCGRYTEFGCCGDSLVDGSAEEIGSVIDESDANYIAALHNFLRTHHATLADMAKRLEAADRDASGEREESWEVWQDDMCVAGSGSLADAQHYMMMYGQDGPVKMVHVVTFRSDVIETVPAAQLAIDATQEGEG